MQEAEIEEDAEATRAVDWDKAAADEAYRAQVERAQERQRILMEQLAREVGGPPASFCSVCHQLASAWKSWGQTDSLHQSWDPQHHTKCVLA